MNSKTTCLRCEAPIKCKRCGAPTARTAIDPLAESRRSALEGMTMAQVELAVVELALQRYGSPQKAAKALGVAKTTLYRRISEHPHLAKYMPYGHIPKPVTQPVTPCQFSEQPVM